VTAITSARLIVGMEVHVELATRSKMFTRAASAAHRDQYDAAPNALVDATVLALPGTLPVMNREAVEMAMLVGLALRCTIASFSKWDRKNYFYPDLPKGYQISQYDLPLCFDGAMEIEATGGSIRRIGIIRAHLEEDAGKLSHELPGGHTYDGSLIDYNRAGTPLLEIVTQPEMTSADEAVAFARELRDICRALGVTEGILQRGQMRFEPNINLEITTEDGRAYRTPIVEVKNLNSFKSVKGAIEYEAQRQVEQWRSDGRVMGRGAKSTRGWDDVRGVTVLQREKEDAQDYRYFPDPDLLPVVVSDTWRREIAARLPELPRARRARYADVFSLAAAEIDALTDEIGVSRFFEACVDALHDEGRSTFDTSRAGRMTAKILLNAGAKRANERSCHLHELGIAPAQVAELIALREEGAISASAADELFGVLCTTSSGARQVASERRMLQVRDASAMEAWIESAVAEQPQSAADYAAGKDAAIGRLVGAVRKLSGGTADAAEVQARLKARLRGGV